MLYKTIVTGLLSLSLTACGTLSSLDDKGTVLRAAPLEYLQETPEPFTPGERTNGALVEYLRQLQEALRSANDDKAAVLDWFKEMLP